MFCEQCNTKKNTSCVIFIVWIYRLIFCLFVSLIHPLAKKNGFEYVSVMVEDNVTLNEFKNSWLPFVET